MNKNNKKTGVSWVKPAEPSFLKKFKSDVGYKEGPTVDTKRQVMPTLDDDSGSDREDELPQVVVIKKGDLSADEVKKIKDETRGGAEKEDEAPADGKILFKKPAKRSSSDKFQGITASSSKKKKSEGEEKKEDKKEDKKEEKSGKKVKNNSLLSFGGDEDEDED
ncbi:uncharacterized protein KIAA1143 homolog isoform X1 [Centroberyx affinis]|uniref:uncharacterized protein KIAA1143 homolog isoform X1 n=1 Tax=Centroberyx affinis TaxID=166261 RepID=UPI003A5BB618